MKHLLLVWLARLVLRLIDWAEPPAKRRAVLAPPPAPMGTRLNLEQLEQLYKADFMFGFAFGHEPSWLAKQLHCTHRN